MGRPLTGTRTDNPGRYSFSCPPARGSRQRRQATFSTQQERDSYADAALQALEAGDCLPEPDLYRERRAPALRLPRDTSFKAVANAWYEQHYEVLRRAGAERALAVRRLLDDPIIPYFDSRVDSVEELAQDLLINFYADFRRQGRATSQPSTSQAGRAISTGPTDPLWDQREVTLKDAAELCGLSLSSIKRAVGPGGNVIARRDETRGCRVVRVAALAAAGHLGVDGNGKGYDQAGRSVAYSRLAVDVIKGVCRYARANGLSVPDITDGLRLVDDEPRQPPRALTWEECRRLATHLHPVWQIAFWLMRSLGLRISEAFGLRVEDVLDLGDGGLIDVFRQGGKPFAAYAADGSIVTVTDKETPKTAASIRLIVACEPVLAMLRTVVAAFHTDPDTGEIDGRARLIPGLADAGRGGQAGFRSALEAAAVAEGLDSASVDFRMSSHLLRKSLTTELAWDEALHESAKRHYVGQRASDDIFGRTYTLAHPQLAPTRAVAAAVGNDINRHMAGTLIVPTAHRFSFRVGNLLQARAPHVWAVLDEAGWTVRAGGPADPLLDAEAVAKELKISVTTARRWMASGRLPSVPVDIPGRPTARHVRLSVLLAARDQAKEHTPLPELAADLDLGYHETRAMIIRLGLRPQQDAATGEFLLSGDHVQAVRTEAERLRALHQRSLRIAHAATELGTGVATINALLRAGRLSLDPETDPSRAKYVTRESLKAEQELRHPRITTTARPDATMLDLAEARAATGLTEGMLLALAKAGHLQRCPGHRRRWAVTRQSLRKWAIAYRPDLLSRVG